MEQEATLINSKLKVGDIVIRDMAGMRMRIRAIKNGLIYCEAVDQPGWPEDELWTFEINTGAEYDPDLHWGSEWGATGSKLIGKVEE